MEQPQVLKPAKASDFLAQAGFPLSTRALEERRKRNLPPAFHRIGNRPVYKPEDLRAFLEGQQ